MSNIEDIYSSVPGEQLLNENETSEYREPILNFLKNTPGEFYTARKIAEACGLPIRGTQVEVRKAITLLIEIDGESIMSNAKGFGYVTNSHQMEFYAKQLEERSMGLQRRIDAVRKIANKMRCEEYAKEEANY